LSRSSITPAGGFAFTSTRRLPRSARSVMKCRHVASFPGARLRISPTSSHLEPGVCRSAGKPCTEVPCVRMIFLSCASRIPSRQRFVVSGQSAVLPVQQHDVKVLDL
jgi:hypothetical protein